MLVKLLRHGAAEIVVDDVLETVAPEGVLDVDAEGLAGPHIGDQGEQLPLEADDGVVVLWFGHGLDLIDRGLTGERGGARLTPDYRHYRHAPPSSLRSARQAK